MIQATSMKTLLNNLITIFENAQVLERVNVNSVRKGIHQDPAQIPYTEFPYISFDDGGQSVEEIKSDSAQRRKYSVMIEIAVNVLEVEQALDDILDTVDQCKAELEREDNRPYLLDSHIWAVNMTTFAWGSDNKFFRGTQIICEFYQLEPRFSDF